MNVARAGLATVTYQGKILAFGGYSDSGYLSSVEEFDPATNAWKLMPPMNTARSNLKVVALGDILYAIGGRNESGVVRSVEAFNSVEGKWEFKAEMNNRPNYFSAVVTQNGRILVIGTVTMQYQSCSRTSWCERAVTLVEEYDPLLDVWTEKTSMDQGDSEYMVNCNKYGVALDAVTYEEVIFLFGFYEKTCGGGPYPATGWTEIRAKYYPETDSWEKDSFAPLGKVKTGFSLTNYGNRFYLAGGMLRHGQYPVYYFQRDNTVDSLDPLGNTWAAEPNLSTFRSAHGASVVGTNLYFIGGKDGDTFLRSSEHISIH
jgi:N-acetylneuraminic acid mutarotase